MQLPHTNTPLAASSSIGGLYWAGPYDPALPGPMRLRLDLEPLGDSSPLGWGVRIAMAQVETGHNYTGLEERVAAGDLDWGRALELVESLCAGCSQANTLAYIQAVEAMSHLIVPPRAAYLRLVLAETERISSHLLNVTSILDVLGQTGREAVLRDLRERMVHAVAEWTGARTQPGLIVYGGLARNIDDAACRALTLAARNVERSLRGQVSAVIKSSDISSRLVGLGKITDREATVGGLRGPVARASGIAYDIRAAFPTGAYEEEGVTIVVQRAGDAYARLVVRLLECLESLRIIEQALDDLPHGPVKARGNPELGDGSAIGRVEGPHGEVFCWIQGKREGVSGLHLSTGSSPSLGVLPGLLHGHNLEDLRILLLSMDLCMACMER